MNAPVRENARSVALAGSEMRLIDAGQGEVVVLGHSYLWNAGMWRLQLAELARHHRVIAPELWGHGASGRLPADTTDLRALALNHLALLDHLGIDRFTLVGHSIGGMWAAELALIAPHRVDGLVLMNTSLGPEPETARQRYFAFLDAVASSETIPEALLDAVVPFFFAPGIEQTQPELPARFRAALRDWDRQALIDSVVPLGRMIFERRDRRGELALLAMPTLVVSGGQDLSRPPHEGRAMADIIGCPFVEIPDAGHVIPLEAPDRLTDLLLQFLDRVRQEGDA